MSTLKRSMGWREGRGFKLARARLVRACYLVANPIIFLFGLQQSGTRLIPNPVDEVLFGLWQSGT